MRTDASRVVLALAFIILARIVFCAFFDPMDVVRAALKSELSEASIETVPTVGGNDYAALQNDLAARANLWKALIDAPATAPEAPVAVVQARKPDLAAMLKGVKIDRGQIGADKIRVITPDVPKGQWVVVGTVINGCTLIAFDADGVTFSYHWKEGDQDLHLTLPRP